MRKSKVIYLLCLLLSLGCKKILINDDVIKSGQNFLNTSKNLQSTITSLDLTNYTFFGQDDFNGTSLDTSVWDYRQENLVRDNYTILRSNVTVSNGTLKLADNLISSGRYGTSQISTQNHPQYWLKYGYFEIRAKLSSGVGTSCSFWLQSPRMGVTYPVANPSINGAEIDIFENGISNGINKLYYSLHWNGYQFPGAQFSTYTDSIPGVYSGFHTFALEWTPKKYIVYVDGVQRTISNSVISHIPQLIILSNFIGGFGGNSTPFPLPDYFEVDYVKAYKRNPEVTVYGDTTFYGWTSEGLQPGSYTTSQLANFGIINNEASSIEVPLGWKITLYDGDNFTGDSVVINSDITAIPLFNNKTSSIKISK